jgi:cytochrome c-type biogenesis protein CcmH/NrfF
VRRRLLALAVAAAIAAPAPTAVAAGCQRTTLAHLENEVMCLVCGVPLALAQAPQADRERAFIAREIGECKTAEQIKTDLVAQYGPRVLALPDARGFRLAAYLVPALAALLVAAALAVVIRRGRGRGEAAITGPPPSARDAARLDAELERYR